MADILHHLAQAIAIFLVVFALNVVPAFAPPTWTVLSFVAVRYGINALLLSAIGATAATCGRLALAKLSKLMIRQKILGEKARANIDEIRLRVENAPRLTVGLFLLYAFSPFPSNNLFIAYGLTGLPLKSVATPFLLGRLLSYTFWAVAASRLARGVMPEKLSTGMFFSYYFIASQLFTILTVYLFTRIDWRRLFSERKVRFRE